MIGRHAVILALLLQHVVAVAVVKGPFKVSKVTLTNTDGDNWAKSILVYYPVAPNNKTASSFPVVAYAHGLFNVPTDYTQFAEAFVSFGFILTIHSACQYGCVRDCVDLHNDPPCFGHFYKQQLGIIAWAKKMHAKAVTSHDATSPFINANFDCGVGVAGHSMGGQSTVFSSSFDNATGADIRAAVMHHAYTNVFPAPRVPFLAFTGGRDDVASPRMTESFFNASLADQSLKNLARGIANKKSADHLEPENGGTYNPLVPQFTAAWFKLHLQGKKLEFGIDFDAMIFGAGQESLCGGGDGEMIQCDVVRGA